METILSISHRVGSELAVMAVKGYPTKAGRVMAFRARLSLGSAGGNTVIPPYFGPYERIRCSEPPLWELSGLNMFVNEHFPDSVAVRPPDWCVWWDSGVQCRPFRFPAVFGEF